MYKAKTKPNISMYSQSYTLQTIPFKGFLLNNHKKTVSSRQFCHNTSFSWRSKKKSSPNDRYIHFIWSFVYTCREKSLFYLPFILHNITKMKASNNCKSTNLILSCIVFILHRNIYDCKEMYTKARPDLVFTVIQASNEYRKA